jgi:hypothetical protein
MKIFIINIPMKLHKPVRWIDPPIDKILKLIDCPDIPDPKIGFVGRLDEHIQQQIFELLNMDKTTYDKHNILLVYFPPNSSIVVHSDNRRDMPKDLLINQTLFLPLKNCDKLKWFWHQVINPDAVFDYSEKKKFNTVPSIKLKDTRPLQDIFCTTPFISNVAQWHNLTNTSAEVAIGISIRLLPWSNQTDFSLPPIPNITYE